MKRKAAPLPILPTSKTDPTGIGGLVARCEVDFSGRFDRIKKGVLDLFKRIPVSLHVNARYVYELDANLLRSILAGLDDLVEQELMQVIGGDLWFYEAYQEPAYRRGSIMAYHNMSKQIPLFKADVPTVTDYLVSERYRHRVALVKARQFELMKGIAGETKDDLSRVLSEGIARGLNPREVSKTITEQIGIEKRRANRIAQTEITGALRRARWDEAEDAQERYQIQTKMLHMSALKPTTRITHAARHGKLYTVEEVREWYAQGAEGINCFCTQIEVSVDENGNILSEAMRNRIPRMRKQSEALINEIEEAKND